MTQRGVRRKIERFKAEPMRPGDSRIRPRGTLLVIGGKEDKDNERLILRRLVDLAAGGKIVIATLASEEPKSVYETYEPVLRGIGARHVFHLSIENREEAHEERAMRILEDASVVFLTGGDQLRITSVIGDSPVYSRMFEIFANGGVIAGTSAGAAVMSETMIVDGNGEDSHKIGSLLQLAPGLGFAKDMIVDQHFAERGRVSRLLAVVAQNPRVLGIGIDENTAIQLQANQRFAVFGDGGVTVLDGRSITDSNIASAERDRTLSVFDVTLHLLSQGDRFDLRSRTPESGPAELVEEEMATA